jgi:hypothetical protein
MFGPRAGKFPRSERRKISGKLVTIRGADANHTTRSGSSALATRAKHDLEVDRSAV